MKHISKKAAIALLTVVLALTMMIPALSFAQPHPVSSMTGLVDATAAAEFDAAANEAIAEDTANAPSAAKPSSSASAGTEYFSQRGMNAEIGTEGPDEPQPGEPTAEVSSAELRMKDTETSEVRTVGDCTATIQYMEYLWEEDPDTPTDDGGRALLGTYTVKGLHEGEVLNAWDYVVDIPGHFFYDGWPFSLTVSSDPAQNVITLIYVKYWDCEYTVNYYVMEGADLTADNWADALKPEDVTFMKVDSETFNGQIYDTLVKGDAYEYQVDGMYVIDTYPAEIRVGMEPDENVINVLYTSMIATGPDSFEVPTDYAVPGEIPDDGTFDKDDIIDMLPEGAAPGDEIYDDFVGTTVRPGELVVTDEMLQHPVNKEQAIMTAQAYETGLHQSGLAQTSDQLPWLIGVLVMGAAIVALAIGVVVLSRRGKTNR